MSQIQGSTWEYFPQSCNNQHDDSSKVRASFLKVTQLVLKQKQKPPQLEFYNCHQKLQCYWLLNPRPLLKDVYDHALDAHEQCEAGAVTKLQSNMYVIMQLFQLENHSKPTLKHWDYEDIFNCPRERKGESNLPGRLTSLCMGKWSIWGSREQRKPFKDWDKSLLPLLRFSSSSSTLSCSSLRDTVLSYYRHIFYTVSPNFLCKGKKLLLVNI